MTRTETILQEREKLHKQYVADIERIEANLCPEARVHWENGTLCVSNASCLVRHNHDKQRQKLHNAVTKTPQEFVPYNMV